VMLPKLSTNDTIETTLDPLVQQAALAALGKYRGSLVAIDPRTNEILAIASSNTTDDLAIERQYEPGSVIKVLTGLNAITNGIDVNSMFPYTCKGELMIDGRHFGDWMPQGHGTLKSLDDALAVSCNVFFADVGIRLKREGLERFMTAAGFNGTAKLGVFDAPLGRITGEIFNNFETAFLAIGLQHESINTLHLAMLASMVANRGMYATPRLLRRTRSIVGDVVMKMPAPSAVRIASDDAAQRVIHAMQAVASDPRGTGRRAPVEGISMAMKTGTAGERKSGLEALIMAFAPVESPRIAFAVIAEDAGPAEFAGAKIAHDFLEKMKPALK
jgi:peptidoglycan glycosyltransferase